MDDLCNYWADYLDEQNHIVSGGPPEEHYNATENDLAKLQQTLEDIVSQGGRLLEMTKNIEDITEVIRLFERAQIPQYVENYLLSILENKVNILNNFRNALVLINTLRKFREYGLETLFVKTFLSGNPSNSLTLIPAMFE